MLDRTTLGPSKGVPLGLVSRCLQPGWLPSCSPSEPHQTNSTKCPRKTTHLCGSFKSIFPTKACLFPGHCKVAPADNDTIHKQTKGVSLCEHQSQVGQPLWRWFPLLSFISSYHYSPLIPLPEKKIWRGVHLRPTYWTKHVLGTGCGGMSNLSMARKCGDVAQGV